MVKREGKETVMEEELTANSDNISRATKRKGDDTANSASSGRKRKAKIPMIEAPPAREVDLNTIQFLFEKKLKKNDVSGQNRIIIPKGDGEKFLPKVKEDESRYIFMDDMKVAKVWAFELRFASLQTSGSKMILLENTAEFIEAHDIKVGDYIIVYKDTVTQRYVVGFRQEYNNDFSDVYRPEFAPPEETNQIFSPNHKFDIDVDTAALGMTKEEFLDLNPFDWFPNDK